MSDILVLLIFLGSSFAILAVIRLIANLIKSEQL